jgi:hypothetical protein
MIGYYLASRGTDDALLGEALTVWAEWEELHEQASQRIAGRGLLRGRRDPRVLAGDEQAALQRYLAAWRRWLDRQAQDGGRSGGR